MAAFLYLIGIISGGGGIVIALGILSWQSVIWLKEGLWPLLTVQDGFNYYQVDPPSSQWVGLEKIILGTLEFPLSVGVFVVGVSLGSVAMHYAGRIETRDRERKNAGRYKEWQKDRLQ